MNKSALRNFAVWARRDLIKRISDRANLLGVYEDKPTKQIQAETSNGFVVNGVTFNYKKEMREAFIKRIQQIGYRDTIEEIAYTWFNRIVALRFMEINGYLKNGNGDKIYVIGSTSAGKTEPDAITYADKLSFVDKFKVYDYQDANDTNGLYRYILTSLCNNLNDVMPLMFEKIDNYAELLLPDHLLDKGAIIDHLVNDISARDFNITIKDDDGENASQVEIVGWLYQFYISEKKEDVFAGLKNNTKITKGTLPAATQIFTPDWIVRYMTDNTLGKMWIESRKSNLKDELKYYLEPAEQSDDVKAKLEEINKEYASKKVTDITFIDPCCGSGHILVYAFDLFFKMYQESGYITSEIPSLILQNNLFGIDVDKRAAQLTSFALTMKALSYDKDFLSKKVYPNVIDIKESNEIDQAELKDFIRIAKLNSKDEEVLLDLIEKFKDAELYGSLIKDFNYSTEQYDILLKVVENVDDVQFNIVDALAVKNVKPLVLYLVKQAILFSSKYDVVVTNPPYAGNSKLPDVVGKYLSANYPNTKYDLFSAFIERNMSYGNKNSLLGIMCPYVWMFIQSYEKLRQIIINSKTLTSLVQLEYGGFAEAVVPICTFTFRNSNTKETGEYVRLEQFKGPDIQGQKTLEAARNSNCGYRYSANSKQFMTIPGNPIAYWVSEKFKKVFLEKQLSEYGVACVGLQTSDNNRFIRRWNEIAYSKIGFACKNKDEAKTSNKKWFPYNKGGNFRKWYGNREYLVNWENDGKEIRAYNDYLNSSRASNIGIANTDYYFRESGSWGLVTSSHFSVRYTPEGSIFDTGGSSVFMPNSLLKYTIGLLNSKITEYCLAIQNPTLNFQPGNIGKLPMIFSEEIFSECDKISNSCIDTSKIDWDQYETSWDFKNNPLIELNNSTWDATGIGATMTKYYGKPIAVGSPLELCYLLYKGQTNERFDILKANEEELNKIFIDIYGLQDELTPNVADKDITVARIYDSKDEIPEDMKGNIYVKTKQDVIKDLISYIVGCAFGRYSPYKDGLIFAGGTFDWNSYFNDLLEHKGLSVKDIRKVVNSFLPSEDNCIMITNNDYAENNMTQYVVDFISRIYGPEHLQENLKFIANALNEKSTDIPANVIRDYLANDFFKDHCKKYQNRPIYWQFDSGKNGGFRALMYLHRYDQNTIPTARLTYLHDIQWKYEQEKERLEKYIENSTIASERTKAQKQLDLINKQILECRAYDEVLNHASNMNITLDLDDGVKVNYQKMQKLDGDKDKNILSTYLKF